MTKKNRFVLGAATAMLVLGGGTGIAVAAGAGTDDGDQTVTGADADRATAAALDATGGGGKANSVERDSENGATWEVEVTRTDGATVDVRLDENYRVVVVEGDREGGGHDGG